MTIKRMFDKLVGDNINFSKEQRVLHASILIIGFNYLISLPIDIFNKMPILLNITNGTSFIIFSIVYYFSRIKKKISYVSIVFFSVIFISFIIDWFPNGGLYGCMPIFYLILLAYIIFLNDGVKRNILLIVYFFDVVIVLIFQFRFPTFIIAYQNNSQRIIDLLFTFGCSNLLIGFLVITLKRLYITEKKNTIDIIETYRKSSEFLKQQMDEKLKVLSMREREIFKLIIEGKSNKEIANFLNISIETVKKHINTLFKKLGAKKRTELLDSFINYQES
jgi:two-component system, sensor histidine kinase LadS